MSPRGVATVVWKYEQDLPDYSQLQNYEPPVMSRVHAADGSLLAEYYHERRLYLPSSAIPPLVKEAFIAAEDKNFYTHPGFDPEGILRAGLVFVQGGKHMQGASTITQQVAKNFLLTNERTFDRKIREILLSMRIEQAYSKDKILELYLNEIYLGLGNYGVEASALGYFNKSVRELSIAEVAYLAALPKEPSALNPFRNHDRAVDRRNYVIGRMEEDGYITAEQAKEARGEPLNVNPRVLTPNAIAAGYFAEEVRRELSDRYGEQKLYEGGLSVRTTLDPKVQLMARKSLVDGLVRYDEAHGWHGVVKSIDLGQDWGVAHADIPEFGDVKPWRLAVVLDANDISARIGLQPDREKSGDLGADRETGSITIDGTKWTGRRPNRGQARRRRLCRADRRQARRIPLAPDSGSVRGLRRDGSVYWPRPRYGRRLLVRPVGVQPGDAGAAPTGLVLQALRLRHGDRQWLYAVLDRARRADRNRSGQRTNLAARELRR